jgi:hypothetical protein
MGTEDETLWLTQAQMAELFQTTPQNVTLYVKSIFAEGEIIESATCTDYLHVRLEGGREVSLKLRHYRLEAVLAVGFRMRSHHGTQTLQHQTQAGLLESTGGRGAMYHLHGVPIPTPDDVFGPATRIWSPAPRIWPKIATLKAA